MIFRVAFLVGLTTLVVIGYTATTRGDDSATAKLGLGDKEKNPWNSVTRWLMEYEATPTEGTKGNSVHKIMAVAAPGEFYHLAAHFSSWYPWKVDPFCQEYFITKGRTCLRWPFNRIYSEGGQKKGEDLKGTIEYDVLLSVVPVWPLTDYKSPTSSQFGIPIIALEAMRSPAYCLLQENESIAGEHCAVFDNKGLDRLWVTKNKGSIVMRRDIRDPRTRRLRQRLLVHKVEQVAPSLWLPTYYHSQFFSANRDVTQDTIEREYKVHILRCVVNDNVPMSIFNPIHPPGSLRFESDTAVEALPGGEDLLSDVVEFMVKYLRQPNKPISHGHPIAWLLGGMAFGLCVGLLLVRKPKNRPAKSK